MILVSLPTLVIPYLCSISKSEGEKFSISSTPQLRLTDISSIFYTELFYTELRRNIRRMTLSTHTVVIATYRAWPKTQACNYSAPIHGGTPVSNIAKARIRIALRDKVLLQTNNSPYCRAVPILNNEKSKSPQAKG